MAFAKADCRVEAVCLSGHPMAKTHAVNRIHHYNWLAPLGSIARAIASARPALIIPADDLAALHLHDLHRQQERLGKANGPICALIEESLGAPMSFPIVFARTVVLNLAREEGIRVPKTAVLTGRQDLEKWAAAVGFPAVLKANGTSGGDGVRIVQTLEEAERAFKALEAPPLLARALKRALLDQDLGMLWPALRRRQYVVNVQTFVPGREATSAVACWKGKVLASLHFEVLNKQDSGGPSTVLRLIENSEMSTAAEKLVRRLKLSGLHGFDFILEERTGDPYLIEINPRATQVGHLALGAERDLPTALYSALSGRALQVSPKITENDTIALFPQEWLRNPASSFIKSGYHDVPWEEADFVLLCIRRRQKQTSWYSQQKLSQSFSKIRRLGS